MNAHLAQASRRAEDEADTLPVSEVFHDTVQGEGPAAGRTASFLRLMGCNLSCSWCDTPYTWDGTRFDLRAETTHRTAAELIDELAGHPGLLVISGGEPLLHQDRPAFRTLLARMLAIGRPVHVETNGTVAPSAYVLAHAALLVVSPKQTHAGPHRGHQRPGLHPRWAQLAHQPTVVFKIVVRDAADVAVAAALGASVGLPPSRTWVMPEGRTAAELAQRWPTIATAAARHGLSASHRLHVLAWGEQRGR